MANNVNAQAILFANQRARPMADLLYSTYLSCKAFSQQWTAQGVATVIPNDSNLIQDGATVASGTADGRTPITDAQVNVLFAHVTDLIAYFEGASGTPTNNASLQNLNQIIAVEVNGRSLF